MNLKLKIYLFFTFAIIFLTCIPNLIAQLPTVEWMKRYNSPSNGNDRVMTMCLDSLGNIYVSGVDAGSPPGFITIKYNSSGTQLWAVRFSGMQSFIAVPRKIGIDRNNNIYIIATDVDGIIIKYNTSGVQQWVNRYRGPLGGGGFMDMEIDSLGHIYVVGSGKITSPASDMVTLRYNEFGDTLWVKSYNRVTLYGALGVALSLDKISNIIVTGNQGTANSTNIIVTKYNSSGDSLWNKEYSSQYHIDDKAYCLEADGQNNLYIAGSSQRTNSDQQFVTLKYSSTGIQQWEKFYHGPAPDSLTTNIPSDMKIDFNDNIYITGRSTTPSSDYDYATLKYNSLGDLLWGQRFTSLGFQNDIPESLCLDKLGNVYITGSFYTVKYYNSGILNWSFHNDFLNTLFKGKVILVNNNNEIFLTGDDFLSTDFDILTYKFSQLIGMGPFLSIIPSQFNLYQNYPNPFNPTTKIKLDIPKPSSCKLIIFDASGKFISVLLNEYLQAGAYNIDFNGGNLSSGIYFFRLIAETVGIPGNFMETKKMILLK